MKALKTALIGAILVMGISSCGNSEPVANYGSSCNKETGAEVRLLIDEQEFISGLSDGYFPSFEQFNDELKAFSDVRSYVRGLDVPLLQTKQDIYVGVMTDFILAYQRYYQSGGQDLTLNNYIMPYNDAEQDFLTSFSKMCADGFIYPPNLIGDPSEGSSDRYDWWNQFSNVNCSDVGRKVWVGNYDPNNLDADGDGWGCESYGG
jgi:hypothetical protein